MLNVEYSPEFTKTICKIKDSVIKERIIRQIEKVLANPEIGKPMRFARKGTRELHIPPFRLSYCYLKEENKIILLDLYHKDEQ